MPVSNHPQENIARFFESYSRALAHFDTKLMAMHFMLPATMLSDDSATVFTEASLLEGMFNQATGFYKQHGILHARPEIWTKHMLTDRIARVKVNWQYFDAANKPLYNCDDHYILKLDRNDEWKIRYVEKDNFCAGDSVLIQAADSLAAGYKYTWTPTGFFNGQNTPTVYSTIFYTSYIKLSVKDKYGCMSADSVMVNTQPCCDMYFPDAFTPNGDGRNDLFRPITVGNHRISTYRITNRWGQQLFETDDERRGWDGRLNGIPQEIGTYYYYIRYKCYDGQYIEKKGSFTLLR